MRPFSEEHVWDDKTVKNNDGHSTVSGGDDVDGNGDGDDGDDDD